jgi:hypothetical protein
MFFGELNDNDLDLILIPPYERIHDYYKSSGDFTTSCLPPSLIYLYCAIRGLLKFIGMPLIIIGSAFVYINGRSLNKIGFDIKLFQVFRDISIINLVI